MTKKSSPPKYRHQKSRNLAVVRIHGKDYYLGEYGSPESRQLYAQLIAEKWVDSPEANTARLPAALKTWPTIDELIARYMTSYVSLNYLDKQGKPTDRYYHVKIALRPLHELYGATPVDKFGPKRLKMVREKMIQDGVTEKGGYSRRYVNDHVAIIKNFFRWGVEEEQVPVDVYQSILAVQQLRKGRERRVKNKRKVKPVAEAFVFKTLPHLPPQLATMVLLQLHSAMRPDEVTIMRPCDIDRSEDIWIYVPFEHKTENHEIDRVIYLGPKCQEFLKPWLDRGETEYLFSPREVVIASREKRRTKTAASAKSVKVLYQGGPREHYNDETYCRAVKRACERAGVPKWTPNQLRHTAATFIRKTYDLETAKIILGHQSVATTEIYAEKDAETAKATMKEIG